MLDKAKELCQNITVLVVEDEQTLRDIIVESMEPYVKEIHVASNGVEGLDAFKNNPIDLIISDIHMAKMNGLRMSHEIRKFDPNVPIIFLTAYDTDDNMLEAIEVKSHSVLRKPFDKRQLLLSMTLAVSNFREEFKAYQLAHDFIYHIESRELCQKNEVISLTKKERRLLELMLNHVVPFLSSKTMFGQTKEQHLMPFVCSSISFVKRPILSSSKICKVLAINFPFKIVNIFMIYLSSI